MIIAWRGCHLFDSCIGGRSGRVELHDQKLTMNKQAGFSFSLSDSLRIQCRYVHTKMGSLCNTFTFRILKFIGANLLITYTV
jgi:hypothetical protein